MPDASPSKATIHWRLLIRAMFMSKALRLINRLAAIGKGNPRAAVEPSDRRDHGPTW